MSDNRFGGFGSLDKPIGMCRLITGFLSVIVFFGGALRVWCAEYRKWNPMRKELSSEEVVVTLPDDSRLFLKKEKSFLPDSILKKTKEIEEDGREVVKSEIPPDLSLEEMEEGWETGFENPPDFVLQKIEKKEIVKLPKNLKNNAKIISWAEKRYKDSHFSIEKVSCNDYDGKCILTLVGKILEGDQTVAWRDGNITVYRSGDVYYGDSGKKGEKNGMGKLMFANGDEYWGSFKDDLIYGKGKYKWNGGKVYVGEFFEGKARGIGIVLDSRGFAFKGTFYHGFKGSDTDGGKDEVSKIYDDDYEYISHHEDRGKDDVPETYDADGMQESVYDEFKGNETNREKFKGGGTDRGNIYLLDISIDEVSKIYDDDHDKSIAESERLISSKSRFKDEIMCGYDFAGESLIFGTGENSGRYVWESRDLFGNYIDMNGIRHSGTDLERALDMAGLRKDTRRWKIQKELWDDDEQ
ncbi:MAG: hypothetical protein LBI29_02510 [Rickettsiales bacterium]|jgi:hypothetical protein|nr:hypothetical protein [Rickettsiales bacterium]